MKTPKYELWYKSPAPAVDDFARFYLERRGWERYALPLGNGYFGACVFGRLETERVQITENSLANPYAVPHTEQRKGSCCAGLNNFAELLFDINHSLASDYRRSLCLDNATASVSYTHGGVRYERTLFTSYPDRVLVIRFTADKSGSVSLGIHPEIPFLGAELEEEGDGMGKTGHVTADGDTITLRGRMEFYEILYEGQLKVRAEGGSMQTSPYGRIWIDNADSVTVLFTCATNYRMESRVFTEKDPKKKLDGFPDPHDTVCETLKKADAFSYEELLQRHTEDYRRYYARAFLTLCETEPQLPTDELLSEYRSGNESRYAEALLFAFGRYLLIASSRSGLPANLQGIWNTYALSPWSGGYWHNINVQMNYWPSGPANLTETFLPYIEYAKAYFKAAEQNADNYVKNTVPARAGRDGDNGWIIGTGAWPYAISGFILDHSGPGTGAFTSLLFWDYYDYTRDKEFLRDFGYPALRGMSLFFTRILQESDGKMLVEDSASPEQFISYGNFYHTVGCAFDQQMVYENDLRTLQAAKILGIDEPLLDEIRRRAPLLDPVLIGDSGQIKEFREETVYGSIGEKTHRHISHLVGLYPGTHINAETPAWIAAAEVTLDGRGDRSTGWAAAHRLCLRARTKNAEKAMVLIRSLIGNNIMENLFDTHPPFQIDGNFGYTAGVCEMLLQSHAGYIELLPALPAEWHSGSFSGLLARGGFEISAAWENGMISSVCAHSLYGGMLKIKLSSLLKADRDGDVTDGIHTFSTRAGDIIRFS